MNWVEFSKPFSDLGELFQAGLLIELNDGEYVLIGNVNEMNGSCDHCGGIESGVIVKRYAIVFSPTYELTASRS